MQVKYLVSYLGYDYITITLMYVQNNQRDRFVQEKL